MRLVHSPHYHVDIGAHVYPTVKYARLREHLTTRACLKPWRIVDPDPASWDELGLVHSPEYLEKVREGRLSPEEQAQIELPWSRAIVEAFRLMVGGTMAAARLAVRDRVAVHLGGGLHHGFAAHGEGFCYFNDVACAIRVLQRDGRIERAAAVDCDVHHGNGTAFIFDGDPSVYTFSIHQQHNYPLFKPRGSLDIGLADGTGDEVYLATLQAALPHVLESRPDLVIYLAGADPYEEDELGGLALTKEGLRRRDRLVLRACREAAIPVAVTLAGGYARRLDDTIAIHAATVEEALAVAQDGTGS